MPPATPAVLLSLLLAVVVDCSRFLGCPGECLRAPLCRHVPPAGIDCVLEEAVGVDPFLVDASVVYAAEFISSRA